jgi:hypothetical protein
MYFYNDYECKNIFRIRGKFKVKNAVRTHASPHNICSLCHILTGISI